MRGFTTLEITISFAILSVVLGGVILAEFSSQYWMITAQTSNEALYHAKTIIEDLRATTKQNFYDASSSPMQKIEDTMCAAGGLCYFKKTAVADLSLCSKYATALVAWRVDRYPTTTTSLTTNLSNPTEGINLGGDCVLNQPAGNWSSPTTAFTADFTGTPSALDVLDGVSYVAVGSVPYLRVLNDSGAQLNTACVNCSGVYNALDVAHDPTTGRTYVYAARNSTTSQLEIIDATDASNPTMIGQATLAGVDPFGSFPQGWRIFYYDRKVYLVTRESAGPELHVFDVGNPDVPVELGSFELTTSVYGMIVHDQIVANVKHRFAYVATSRDPYELMVLDATTPSNITEVVGARVDLPGSATARALAMNGDTLYVGRDLMVGGPELFAFDASNPLAATTGLPMLGSVDLGAAVLGLRVSGQFIFAAVTNQMLIRNVSDLSALGSYTVSGLSNSTIDLDGDFVYLASVISPRLRVLKGI